MTTSVPARIGAVLAISGLSVAVAAAVGQPLNSVERYPIGTGQESVSAPFCDSAGGATQVRVWGIDQVAGRSGRGGGIYISRHAAIKAASVLDATGATVAQLAISGNSATVGAKLAPGCYTVRISAVGSGTAGGMIGVRVTSGVSPDPGPAGTSGAPPAPKPAPKDDDS